MNYTVNPVQHQPQWPANDNKPEPSRLVFWVGMAMFALFFCAVIALGIFSMTGKP